MDEAEQRNEIHLARKIELERQREEILRERERLLSLKSEIGGRVTNSARNSSTSSSRLSVQIEKTKKKIPDFERKVQTLRKENIARTDLLRKPYDGEMGIGSYEPWQLEDFYFVREFVRSWIDEVLDFIVREGPRVKSEHDAAAIAERFFKELDVERKRDEMLQMSLDIEQSILTDVIYQAAKETAAELMDFEAQTRTMLDRIILDSFDPHSESSDQRKISLLNNALSQLKKEALKKRDVWSHSQTFHRNENDQDNSVTADEEEDTFDGTLLHFHDITPFRDLPDVYLPPEQVDFHNTESEFWMGNTVDLCTLPLPRRYRGISCTSLSPDNSLIALGTVQGDIPIWDLATFPPRILRTSRGNNSAVVQLHWSFDSSQIVSLNEFGAITLWSLSNTTSIPYDVRSFEPVEVNIGFKPTALIPLLTLEPRDFLFTKGPFSDSRDLTSAVTAVAFHPSSTLLGRQAFLMVGYSNGNILRLRYNKMVSVVSSPQVHPANGITHKIGKDVEAELFKEHRNKIVLIAFVNNVSPMVTVDEKGYINMWEYSSECLTGFGWFVPSIKYRLNMVEMTYEPVIGTQEKVEFTDEVKGPKHKQNRLRQEMVQNRKKAQRFINSLHLEKPWQTQEMDNKVTKIFVPQNVPESGATFHLVTYNRTSGQLASYVTKVYKPLQIPCSKFISCKQNYAGSKLVFMLLFPAAEPREAHVSLVIINLEPTVSVSKNYMHIALAKDDYAKCLFGSICSLGISQAVDATGSEYIITNVNGNLSAVSMTTGNEVMAETQKGWVGCHLSLKKGQIPPTSKVEVLSTSKGLQVLLYARRLNSAALLQVRDENAQEQRRQTWIAFQKWIRANTRSTECAPVPLQMMKRHSWTFEGHSDVHIQCFMESLVLDLVDDAVQIVDGSFTREKQQTFHAENVHLPFLRKISQETPQDADGGNMSSQHDMQSVVSTQWE